MIIKEYSAKLIIKAWRLKRLLWERACALEDIPATSKFVIFSSNNKYSNRYDRVSMYLWNNTNGTYV